MKSIECINDSREKILFYYRELCSYFLERDDILKLMITAMVAREPMLFIGRPGTAKSLLVSVFCDGMGLGGDQYFEYMLTKFTEPSEVWKVEPREEVPKKTNGKAHAAITINNLGPVKKFLSDSIIVFPL